VATLTWKEIWGIEEDAYLENMPTGFSEPVMIEEPPWLLEACTY
jgi:hypothetical protein